MKKIRKGLLCNKIKRKGKNSEIEEFSKRSNCYSILDNSRNEIDSNSEIETNN